MHSLQSLESRFGICMWRDTYMCVPWHSFVVAVNTQVLILGNTLAKCAIFHTLSPWAPQSTVQLGKMTWEGLSYTLLCTLASPEQPQVCYSTDCLQNTSCKEPDGGWPPLLPGTGKGLPTDRCGQFVEGHRHACPTVVMCPGCTRWELYAIHLFRLPLLLYVYQAITCPTKQVHRVKWRHFILQNSASSVHCEMTTGQFQNAFQQDIWRLIPICNWRHFKLRWKFCFLSHTSRKACHLLKGRHLKGDDECSLCLREWDKGWLISRNKLQVIVVQWKLQFCRVELIGTYFQVNIHKSRSRLVAMLLFL